MPSPGPRGRAQARVAALARRIALFRAMPHDEQLALLVVGLHPTAAGVDAIVGLFRTLNLAMGNQAAELDRLRKQAEAWSKLGLVSFEAGSILCDADLGTYLSRMAAETKLGDALRRCPTLERSVWRGLPGLGAQAYTTRLMRIVGKVDQASILASQWIGEGGQLGSVAALFGPGDPMFLLKHLDDFASAVPKVTARASRALQDVSWHVAFYEALCRDDREAAKDLLLSEDQGQFANLQRLTEQRGLAKSKEYQYLYFGSQLLWGQHALVRERAKRSDHQASPVAHAALGIVELAEGNIEKCIEEFVLAHQFEKGKDPDDVTCRWFGAFEVLALLAKGDKLSLVRAAQLLRKAVGKQSRKRELDDRMALVRLGTYYEWCVGQPLLNQQQCGRVHDSAFSLWLGTITVAWMSDLDCDRSAWVTSAKRLSADAKAMGYTWFASDLNAAVPRLTNSLPASRDSALSLVTLVVSRAPWELSLASLQRLVEGDQQATAQVSEAQPMTRVAWYVAQRGEVLEPHPRLQMLKNATFTHGRAIALRRLIAPVDAALPLSDIDRKVASHLVLETPYYGAPTIHIDDSWPLDLIGHPFVFDAADECVHYDVKRGQVWLRCERNASGEYILRLEPEVTPALYQLANTTGAFVRRKGSELIVYEVTQGIRQLALQLGQESRFPKEAEGRLAALLPALSALVPTSGTLSGDADGEMESGDTTPVLRIRPRSEAFRVQLLVTPLGTSGPLAIPGEGAELLADYSEGKTRRVRRNLGEERARAEQVLALLPSLGDVLGDCVWTINGLSACLEVVANLAKFAPTMARVEWPEGQPFKLKQIKRMKLTVTGGDASRWFEVDGKLTLSDDSLLTVAELLARLKQRDGRFVELSKGNYAELAEDTLEKLRLIESFAVTSGKSSEAPHVRIAPWLALALPNDSELLGCESTNVAWHEWRKQVTEVCSRSAALPKGFHGQLRDYQLQGYQWLCRMALLGVGVCLADDMGLGKTIQALALLEQRANRKLATRQAPRPMLIVAPASVCPNWVTEAGRFTPDLALRLHSGAERSLDQLTRKTVIVCTYDVMTRDREEFAKIAWDTVVLDEAQQIKNAHTLRARAAFALNADFRLATTGTPIENHLGELWSLYRFLMPGLLGDQHAFVERFRAPIENSQDGERRRQLQRLVKPFLLRRTKQQVLSELPPRTELVRRISLSEQERALYEAIRLRGLESLQMVSKDKNQQRVRVLAELMRLRRSCCHPRLVLPDSDIPSSKLATVLELIDELRDGGHRALVFSQFVDHLTLVRESLDDSGISYQYLDGSTPIPERGRRVAAFQAGDGELFLISLRAGGTGLNLTAADYVIHLDPWWNPAVEDQASDRAHRIGQHRPVTVYRLVAEGTIEERLVAMHGRKRSLAADILEGSEGQKRFDPDALMDLLRESALPEAGVTARLPAVERRVK